jgi:prepilin-type N-terminal cleavage/methylation domain-containing protein
MDRLSVRRGYTLVELMIGMTLASVLMLGVLSTYLFLGRNSTRLSYQHALEIQARTILNSLALDVRNTKQITSASSSGVSLKLVDGSTVTYSYSAGALTRDTGSGPVALTSDIKGEKVQVAVTLPTCTFTYFTTTDGDPTSQFGATLVPLSVKQVAVNLVLQAGTAGVQDQAGTMTSFKIASGWLLFRNKQLPDGT